MQTLLSKQAGKPTLVAQQTAHLPGVSTPSISESSHVLLKFFYSLIDTILARCRAQGLECRHILVGFDFDKWPLLYFYAPYCRINISFFLVEDLKKTDGENVIYTYMYTYIYIHILAGICGVVFVMFLEKACHWASKLPLRSCLPRPRWPQGQACWFSASGLHLGFRV